MTLVVRHYVCPCCGFPDLEIPPYENITTIPVSPQLEPPYAQYFGMPSYAVCPCCGFEFGNDDEPGAAAPVSFARYREEWMEEGAVWFHPEMRPDGWPLQDQLKGIGFAEE